MFLNVLKRILSNPMGLFVYAILTKWYLLIAIPSVVVTYWVFKGLESSGLLNAMEIGVVSALDQIKGVAQHCVPKIGQWTSLWDCLQNTPAYIPDVNEGILQNQLQQDFAQPQQQAPQVNPYNNNAQ